jgi:hypothetical protein
MKALAPIVAGVLFGAGLVVSGMTDPANVVGFLDFFGDWRPELMFVMGGAIAVNLVLMKLILRRPQPLFDSQFHLPTRRDIDGRLVLGSALFGIGWGLAGFCPGPGVVAAAAGNVDALIFVVAMTAAMFAFRAFDRLSGKSTQAIEFTTTDA